MAGYEVNVGSELLPGLLNGQDGLAKLVEAVLNQVLEAQVMETLGATRHERTDERAGYRNGYRPRTLYTRVGPVTWLVPQTQNGTVLDEKTTHELFDRHVAELDENAVQSVSTKIQQIMTRAGA